MFNEIISVNESIARTMSLCTANKNSISLPARDEAEIPVKELKSLQSFLKKFNSNWESKTQSFKFSHNIEAFFSGVVNENKAPKPNPFAFHPTPNSVIDLMLNMASYSRDSEILDRRILEPHGGSCNILNRIKGMLSGTSTLDTCEIDYFNRKAIVESGFNLVGSDFLEYKPTFNYHCILANPPFTAPKDPNAYITHIKHALSMLSPTGTLVTVAPISFLTSTNKIVSEFRQQCFEDITFEIEIVDKGEFQTTNIATCVIALSGMDLAQPSNAEDVFYERAYLIFKNDPRISKAFFSLSDNCEQSKLEEIIDMMLAVKEQSIQLPLMYENTYIKLLKNELKLVGLNTLPSHSKDQYLLF